jgi:serine/threonine protein kinase/class 3 adenylate cyclase
MQRDPTEQRRLATIVFTDIVGSTRLKQELGEREALSLIKAHHALIRETLNSFPGSEEIETAGDSFFLVFAKPSDAARFALLVQSRLRIFAQNGHSVQDRIGIHVGEVLLDGLGDPEQPQHPSGMHVDTCARVMSLARGDQILLTRFAFDNARSVLRGEEIQGVGPLSWMNHGSYLLKGVEEPVEICEVGEGGLASLKAPADVEKAHRQVPPGEEPVLGWRPALDQVVPNTKWVLERKLGEGGFGEVWLGRHEALKERRVFKFCFRADRVRSLKREVTLFRVMREKMGQHPNIVGIQEVFFDQPPFYIVMNYAEGQDLRAWCDAQGGAVRVPLATRLEIVAQVADGLQAAHEAGVIHRDIKPTNILIRELSPKDADVASADPSDRPIRVQAKVTDFGIGQVLSEEALAGVTKLGFTQTMLSPGSSSHTGTQLYMAPELLAGQPASTGSDIYSLGMVLYQLLVGEFSRPLTIDWARRIEDPLLREDLEKCFSGSPQERFADVGELAKALRSVERRRVEAATRARANRRQALVKRATAAILGLGFLVAGLIWVYPYISQRPGRVPVALKKVAVMPFVIKSEEASDAYLTDALTTEVINSIRKVPGLNAIRSRSSQEILEILAQSQVDWLLQGSIQRSEGKLRIVADLMETAGNKKVTQVYDRDAQELLGLPNDLALLTASNADVTLSAADRSRVTKTPTTNNEAYDSYLRGLYALQTAGVGRPTVGEAIPMLEQAVALDDHFMLAYAALAQAYVNEYAYFKPSETERLQPKAWTAISHALKLDYQAAEPHAAAGLYFWTPSNHWQHTKALEEYGKAFKADPWSEDACGSLSLICTHLGLFEKAGKLAQRAFRINPLNSDGKVSLAIIEAWQGDYSNAIAQIQSIPFANLHFIQGANFAVARIRLGQTNEVRSIIQTALIRDPQDLGGLYASVEAVLCARLGDPVGAKNKIDQARRGKAFLHFHHTLFHIALAYALLGDTTRALDSLKQAADDGFPCYELFKSDLYLKGVWETPSGRKFLEDLEKRHRQFETLVRSLELPELQ